MKPGRTATAAAGFVALVLFAAREPRRAMAEAAPAPRAKSGFESSVRPILEARCQPCHFSGGKIYDRFPFDSEDVVRRLGTARLFTRLKDEKDRAVVREWLKP